ncbi:hypothetical protein [Aliiroseovarius crassostreae]|uniref:hypothetical protein n=1 Tax=Aliiroseovarius crassostreae TaxID=154981 RepID=UPI0021FC1C2F|nr:hypothetical protein [Aliiroseovarius crassostreae]UWQ06664.1 hypothetical protein K3X22_15350 [Aliiroseovarius crassostreae]
MRDKNFKEGDWISSLHGISQVLRINLEQPDPPLMRGSCEALASSDRAKYIIYKTFLSHEGKVKRPSDFENCCSITLCDPATEAELEAVKVKADDDERRWIAFQNYTTVRTRNDVRLGFGYDASKENEADQFAAIISEIALPEGGLSLGDIAHVFREKGVESVLWEHRSYNYTDLSRYFVSFRNAGALQNSQGLDVFDQIEVTRRA